MADVSETRRLLQQRRAGGATAGASASEETPPPKTGGSEQINPDSRRTPVDIGQNREIDGLRERVAALAGLVEGLAKQVSSSQTRQESAPGEPAPRSTTPGPEATPDNKKEAPVAGSTALSDLELEVARELQDDIRKGKEKAERRRLRAARAAQLVIQGELDPSHLPEDLRDDDTVQKAVLIHELSSKGITAGEARRRALESGSNGSSDKTGSPSAADPKTVDSVAADPIHVDIVKQAMDNGQDLEEIISTMRKLYPAQYGDKSDPKHIARLEHVFNVALDQREKEGK